MTSAEIKRQVEYLKNNCSDFINEVHDYMVEDNWTWWDNELPPTIEEITDTFFDLLNHMCRSNIADTGGFHVCKNEDTNCIECYFGHNSMKKEGIKFSADEMPMSNTDIMGFISYICKENKALNKSYLKEMWFSYEGHKKD